MLFHGTDGHFLPVEDACCESCLHVGFIKDLREVFHAACAAGRDDRNGDRVTQRPDQFDVKARVGAVLVNAVEQNFTGPEVLARPGKGHGIQVSALSAALDCTLIPAVSFPIGAGGVGLDDVVFVVLRPVHVHAPGVHGDDHGLIAVFA